MIQVKGICNSIILILLLFSLASPVCAEALLIKENAAPLIANEQKQILLVNGTGIFLTTGDSWNFYQGYVLTARSVNLEQKQVWVRLLHENELLKEAILSEGDIFIYSGSNAEDHEILNITVDTIYTSPEGELITFRPVYQYQDQDLPMPVIPDDDENAEPDNGGQLPGDDVARETVGFTIIETFACVLAVMLYRR
ncbi:S-layer protein domain-containing protein [Methanolobus sp. WCC5]|jgi:hypothetical protein|uniref:S-layer protein domain-containing protein n=1 Tax=Methanolobus sp. WCC5 TaxID=3125785 RepID=UPI003243E816